ncbi:alpha/beta hydrolase [Metabacillus sp. GX 13764]|uniref:alpha/beta hydrolase n=1 Tax=Metabacillus kandeliae TaxID=2900151 RepID=UPI001E3FA336|nr:alpha/beta hydrolase-fold protein [Metabacillus kandeliae]MCD7034921.1 alpha/beta hydrolase [Metabacillus kandeliae]
MLENFTVTITPFGRKRNVTVYLPNEYETTQNAYPVLYMHDGQNVFRDEDASYGTSWGIPEYLEQSGFHLIVVGLDCNHERYNRFNEYGPWQNAEISKQVIDRNETLGGEGAAYIDYIVHELKPFIDAKYRTLPEETSMMGSSMGGLITTYAACKYPAVFKKAASLSSAYWFNQKEIEAFAADSALQGLERFYMDIGTNERSGKIGPEQYVASSIPVYDILKEKVPMCEFKIFEGAEHNEGAWRARLGEVFGFLFLEA